MIGLGFEIPKLAALKINLSPTPPPSVECNFKTEDNECIITDDSEIFNVQAE